MDCLLDRESESTIEIYTLCDKYDKQHSKTALASEILLDNIASLEEMSCVYKTHTHSVEKADAIIDTYSYIKTCAAIWNNRITITHNIINRKKYKSVRAYLTSSNPPHLTNHYDGKTLCVSK